MPNVGANVYSITTYSSCVLSWNFVRSMTQELIKIPCVSLFFLLLLVIVEILWWNKNRRKVINNKLKGFSAMFQGSIIPYSHFKWEKYVSDWKFLQILRFFGIDYNKEIDDRWSIKCQAVFSPLSTSNKCKWGNYY